ncbi:unnamed protein product [Linum tenue]|uniref:Uncharacterized protein n=1 Tax=Linum tenue TaxID=586396 RepID=A0AAV0N5A2_9ROSI|nr:unnamed protein product [Linum tenue]
MWSPVKEEKEQPTYLRDPKDHREIMPESRNQKIPYKRDYPEVLKMRTEPFKGTVDPKVALDWLKKVERGPIASRMAKKAINEGVEVDLHAALDLEEVCYELLLNTNDRLEGLAAFAEK